jgi:hypothetical protein
MSNHDSDDELWVLIRFNRYAMKSGFSPYAQMSKKVWDAHRVQNWTVIAEGPWHEIDALRKLSEAANEQVIT